MSPDSSSEVPESSWATRRCLLALGGAGGAAGLATLLSQDRAWAGHGGTNVFHLGQDNTNPAGSETQLNANGDGHALILAAGDSGPAFQVQGGSNMTSDTAADVGDTLFVSNESTGAAGGGAISATAHGDAHAIEGVTLSENGVGVQGISGGDPYGEGPGTGVVGHTGTGVGVLGIATGTGVGVEAHSRVEAHSDGLALAVRGKSAFSTAGSAVVPAGQESVFVENAAVTGNSHITVTLTTDPGDRQVSWVDRDPGSGFTVHLTQAPPPRRPETSLTYLIVEPGFTS